MELPDDCKFIDYSVLDVKKAAKKLAHHPMYIQEKVLDELDKINTELAYHLRERLLP